MDFNYPSTSNTTTPLYHYRPLPSPPLAPAPNAESRRSVAQHSLSHSLSSTSLLATNLQHRLSLVEEHDSTALVDSSYTMERGMLGPSLYGTGLPDPAAAPRIQSQQQLPLHQPYWITGQDSTMYSTASSSSSSSSSNSLGLFDMPSPSSSLFSCDAPRHRETTSSSLDGCLFFGTMDDEPLPGAFDFLPESRDLHDDLEARIDEWCPSPELIPVDLPPLPRHHIDPRIPKEFGWFDYREEEQDTPDTPPSPPCRSPSLLPATTKVALVALPPSPPISPLALPQLSTFTRLLPSAAATTSSYDASSAIATAFFLDPSSPSSLSPLPSAHYSLRKHGQPLTFTSLSTLRGSLPPTSTSPDFIRAQRCVASCSFDPSAGSEAGGARRSVEVKPVRIKEHIIKCEERRKVFAEAEETDELRMLCEAQVDKLRRDRIRCEIEGPSFADVDTTSFASSTKPLRSSSSMGKLINFVLPPRRATTVAKKLQLESPTKRRRTA